MGLKWKKIGNIFNPEQHGLPQRGTAFAQSPQALVFDEFIRVYFSMRKVDPTNGKYLSHVAFAEFRKNLRDVISVSTAPVIELGRLGCFDEHGIFPMNVLRVEDLVYGYTSGWSRRRSVSVDTSIGLAISRDGGLTFQKSGDGPILTSSLNEPFLVGDPFVQRYGSLFHMWYIFGSEWKMFPGEKEPERIYKIGHAVSEDGVDWQKEDGRAIVPDRLGTDECQAHPTVIAFDNCYHMFFCYRYASDFRTNRDRGYRIGYASSTNLIDWVRNDRHGGLDLSSDGWDSEMMCYPHVFACEGKIHLLYNGNNFGRSGFGLATLA